MGGRVYSPFQVSAHTQVRDPRGSAAACWRPALGTPSPWPLLSFTLYFGHVPSWQLFELLPFFVHCCFCIRNFHRLEDGNELAREIVMTQRVEHLFRNVIFVTF